jgi:hypothetical protein
MPALDLLAQNQQLQQLQGEMQAAGNALSLKVAALEKEKAQLLALRGGVSSGAGGAPRPKGPAPPEFHGIRTNSFEIDAWVRDMKVQFEFYGPREFPDDATKIRHATMFLKGRAAEWWEAEDKSGGVRGSRMQSEGSRERTVTRARSLC